MPTIGYRPTLETTQAVGALLLHQFARERFLQAGVDENLIREAEYLENVDQLVTQTLLNNMEHDSGGDMPQDSTKDSIANISNQNAMSDLNQSDSHTQMDNISSTATRNSFGTLHDLSSLSSTLNATTNSEQQEQIYHSIQEQSMNRTTATNATGNPHDKTLYHSVVNSTNNESISQLNTSNVSTSNFDRLQSSPRVTLYGDELRKIAEEFERSSLREIVRNRANQVNLADITKESFTRLLKELFQEKITREKIVILFFFCTDVALRAAEFAQGLVVRLLGWSFSYIINTVCSFVHKLGGWDKVLFYQLPSLLITCCAGLAICALMVFLRNSVRTPVEH